MLDEEERSDQQMREQFKERWTPSPSNKLTVQLREEGKKYRTILDNATNADQVVKDKYNTHRRGLEVLSKSEVWSVFLSENHFIFFSGCLKFP